MAKPNAQTGHGSSSGTADESTLPHGEASRRGADDNADGSQADWGLPNAKDESKLSRILGLVLVLVLAGVFSFIAYRKYNEARLHPTPEMAANGTINPQPHTGVEPNGEAQNSIPAASPPQDPAGGAAIASNSPSPNQSQSAFQLDDTPNSNAPFRPNGVGQAPEAPAARPAATHSRLQTAANENDVNPFNDTPGGASSAHGGTAEKGGALEVNRPNAAGSKSVAAGEQVEPLFETPGKQSAAADTRQNQRAAADSVGATAHQESGKVSIPTEPEPVAHSQTAAGNQAAAAPSPPGQGEPATNDLLNDSTKPAVVAKDDRQAPPSSSVPNRSRAPSAGLLDQEEPLPTAARREPSPAGPGSPASLDAQSAQTSSTTTVHVSAAPSPPSDTSKGSDNEDLFATKTADARPTAVVPMAPQAGRQVSVPSTSPADASLNEAGDYYVVRPQDNFWTISRKKYGTARYFMALAQLNKAHVPDPTRMRPGLKVATPPTEILETRFAQYLPKGSAVEPASGERPAGKSGPAGFFMNSDGKAMYRTGEKDTLSDIAARHLGRASRWIQIYEMNRDKLATPNQLKIGTELVLPADASNVAVTNENEQRR